MSRIVNLRMLGRFGNQMFQYAFARAYAEKFDCELRTDPWIGETLFQIDNNPIRERFSVVRSDLDFVPGEANIELYGYFQSQQAMLYTKADAMRWFQWRLQVATELGYYPNQTVAHLRRGDYFGYGYPVVSLRSYHRACEQYGFDPAHLCVISEENPTVVRGFPPFVGDFWRLTTAPVLFRANSSFSWWAATIAPNQRVFSPIIEGREGGKEHDVEFVEGNWPRFTNLHYVTDLHL